MKRPAFQFYPSDWRNDSTLKLCSLTARGLWIEIMCIMHDCSPYGYLAINNQQITITQLSRLIGEPESLLKKCLQELEQANVFSRTPEGIIYSRRMVKDESIRCARAAAGKLGGNPNLLNQKDNQNSESKVNRKPTPSSSSPSPSSLKELKPLLPHSTLRESGVFEDFGNGKPPTPKDSAPFNIINLLDDDGIASARKAAPGWDIYHLATIYNADFSKRGMPKYPARAFAGWCEKYTKGKSLNG